MSKKIDYIISELEDQYLMDDDSLSPWIIGFSGGKDSTALLQLVWYALKKIPRELRNRKTYVIFNDTLIENTVITEYVFGVLNKIQHAVSEQSFPMDFKIHLPN
ncbi:MAG: hypothetical protein KJ578_05510 [Bacteroidetes bacterium]|nr:hypothetical protein [Bacteroidota bacterium]MBU1580164.1 hypothetical protein [Bacteroidota bacterium]MBU2465887.1 hypothetical protein [Bacteroidota bacterium]MBU2557222.1 hypothetical protein [Bacteroidota bacterium]